MRADNNPSGYYDRFLAAVEKILNGEGYENVTIRKVCKEAGLAPGTFYRYFSGKNELLSARLDEDNSTRAQYLEGRLQGLSSVQKVFFFSRYYAEMNYEAEPGFHLVMFTPMENWHRKKQPLLDLLMDIFADGQKNGEVKDHIRADELAVLFLDVLRGCIHCWCVQHRSFDLRDRIEKITRVFMHSFAC